MVIVTATIYCLGESLRAFPSVVRCLPEWGNCLLRDWTGPWSGQAGRLLAQVAAASIGAKLLSGNRNFLRDATLGLRDKCTHWIERPDAHWGMPRSRVHFAWDFGLSLGAEGIPKLKLRTYSALLLSQSFGSARNWRLPR